MLRTGYGHSYERALQPATHMKIDVEGMHKNQSLSFAHCQSIKFTYTLLKFQTNIIKLINCSAAAKYTSMNTHRSIFIYACNSYMKYD